MKSMKNIKPAYAVKLGTGVFAGTLWQCIKCGATMGGSAKPSPNIGGKCQGTPTGNHIWTEV